MEKVEKIFVRKNERYEGKIKNEDEKRLVLEE